MTRFPFSLRLGLAAGGAVLVLGGAAVGIAAAQTPLLSASPSAQQQSGRQQFIDALAKRLNISSATLETAISQARTDVGASGDDRGFRGFGPGFPFGNSSPFGPGFPFGNRGGPGDQDGPRGVRGFRLELNVAATAVGIPVDQLRTELNGKSLAQVAQAHGKTGSDVATALKNAEHQRIDQAVTIGRLTAAQATTLKEQVDRRIDDLVNQVVPQRGQVGQNGPGGRDDDRDGRGDLRGAVELELNVAATAVGIPLAQLQTELRGKSLAQVAQAHGKTASDVSTALKNAAHQRIDQAVTNGRLTAARAATMKQEIDQRIDRLVNQVVPPRGQGSRRD